MNTAKHNLKVCLYEDGSAVVWTSVGPVSARSTRELAELMDKIAKADTMDTWLPVNTPDPQWTTETLDEYLQRGGDIEVVRGSLRRGKVPINLSLEDIGL